MMKKLALFIGLFMLSISSLLAQDAQISFDSNGKVMIITQQIESRAKMFPDYVSFREAALFQTGAESYLLEITYLKAARLVRDKRVLSQQELNDLRFKFSESDYFKSSENRVNQEGRRAFLSVTTSWASAFYGYSIPLALEFGPRATIGTYMLLSGVSFYAPFVSSAKTDITKSMSYLTFYGATRSFLHGAALNGLIVDDKTTYKGIVLTSAAVSLTEMMLGYSYARNSGISHGRAQAIGLFMDYGLYSGVATSFAMTDEPSPRFSSILALTSTGLGMYLGSKLTVNEDKSVGDVSLMYSTTIIGGLIANAVGNSISRKDTRIMFASSIIGSSIGLYYGNRVSKEYDFSDNQGSFIRLSSLSGYLTGLGASYVFFGEISDKTINPYFLVSSLGAAAGYYIMFNYFKDKAFVKTKESAFNVDFSINPLGIAGVIKQKTDMNVTNAGLFGNWGSVRVNF